MAAVLVAADSRPVPPGTSTHPCSPLQAASHPHSVPLLLLQLCDTADMEMLQVTQDAQNHLPLPFNPILSHLLTQFDLISPTSRVRHPKLQHPHTCLLYGLQSAGPMPPKLWEGIMHHAVNPEDKETTMGYLGTVQKSNGPPRCMTAVRFRVT